MATATPTNAPPQHMTAVADSVIKNSRPIFEAILKGLDASVPLIEAGVRHGQTLYRKLKPYHLEDVAPLILGLVLIFFGGNFPVLIAAVEAFRITGWENTRHALTVLFQQYKVAMEASRKDDELDENKDGIPDVKQVDTRGLVIRKVGVFMKAANPQAVNEAVHGLTAGFTAVVATLRMHFAQTITLGVSLGDVFTAASDRVVRPALEKVMPLEHHKWIGLFINYSCRSLAVTIAWWCQRVISALHSAMRGAQLVMLACSSLAKRNNIKLPIDLSSANETFPAICTAIGGMGLYSQIMRGFALPFPLNILLLPLRILEWVLFYFLASSPK